MVDLYTSANIPLDGGAPEQRREVPSVYYASEGALPQRREIQSELSAETHAEAVSALCRKISWASQELERSSNVEYCISLCQLIKASVDALQSLKVYR